MQFPALNWPILLFQYIRRLALPIEVYPAVKNLRELVGFKFTFPGVTSSKRQILHRSPETQLVSLIVVVTKLLFSFDKIRRYPVSGNEPTTQAVDWTVWSQVQRQFANRDNAEGHITRGEEILTTEKDVFQMDPSQLDDYMDWYENSWLDPAPSKGTTTLQALQILLFDIHR